MQASIEIARLTSFLVFLLLGIRVMRTPPASRHRAVTMLLLYVIAINGFAGVTQVDNWPFTSNTLAVGRGTEQSHVTWASFYGVDSHGREWQIDPLTWSPVFDSILQNWMRSSYPRLSPPEQKEAMRFLLARANAGRARLRDGRRIGFDRRIGPLSCPYWWRLPRVRDVPPEPYQSLRAYELDFVVAHIIRDPHDIQRRLLGESAP